MCESNDMLTSKMLNLPIWDAEQLRNRQSRKDMTTWLTLLGELYIDSYTSYWAHEVRFRDQKDSGRVDMLAYLPECNEFHFYEVKSCLSDFKQSYGHNFVGDRNFLICPRRLAVSLYQQRLLPTNADVLCPDPFAYLTTVYQASNSNRDYEPHKVLSSLLTRMGKENRLSPDSSEHLTTLDIDI